VLILRSLCNERVNRLKTLHIILWDHFVQFRAINRHNISHASVWTWVRTAHWVTAHVHSCRNFAKLLHRSTWRPLQAKFMIQPTDTDSEPCNCRLTCSVAVFISKPYSLINQRRITTVLWTSQRYLNNRTVICILNNGSSSHLHFEWTVCSWLQAWSSSRCAVLSTSGYRPHLSFRFQHVFTRDKQDQFTTKQ
jgi:hypothetical protein